MMILINFDFYCLAFFFVGLVQKQTGQMQANSEANERNEAERKSDDSDCHEEDNECCGNNET